MSAKTKEATAENVEIRCNEIKAIVSLMGAIGYLDSDEMKLFGIGEEMEDCTTFYAASVVNRIVDEVTDMAYQIEGGAK